MASFWKVNQTSTNGSIRYWDMIETMLAAGWTMQGSGDGTTLHPPGDSVSHGGTGARGLGNTTAWVRLQDPGGGREIVIQRMSNDTNWSLVYSPSAKFITGGSATIAPTAADQYFIINNVSTIQPTTNSRHHCWASDAAPYPFYLIAYKAGGEGFYTHLTMMDEIIEPDPGTDPDPIVFIRGGNGANSILLLSLVTPPGNTISSLSAFGRCGPAYESLNIFPYFGGNSTNFYGFAGSRIPSSYNKKVCIAPCFFLRKLVDSNSMSKGFAKNFLLGGRLAFNGNTYSVNSERDKIVLTCEYDGSMVLPFNGTEPVV
jgi:hypothetical protein